LNQATKLQGAERKLKQLVADVSRAMEKAQEAVLTRKLGAGPPACLERAHNVTSRPDSRQESLQRTHRRLLHVERVLRNLGIDTILIAGTKTNVCCEATARDAMMLDFKVVMVGELCGGVGRRAPGEPGTTIQQFGDLC